MYSSRRSAVKQRSVTLKDSVSAAAKDVFHQSDNEELPKNPFNYTLDDLQAIEKERRSLLTRVKRFSLINISTSFYGTVLPDIVRSTFSWFNLVLYIAIRVIIKMECLTIGLDLPQINTTLVSIVGSFMSFFLVFFVSQAYTRFCVQYDNSMRIEGRLLNLAFFARNNLDTVEAWRFVRYINAIHVAGYTGLSHIYTENNIFDQMNAKHQLLTDVEIKRVKEIGLNSGGTAYREILGWCYEILYGQYRKHRDQFDVISFQTMLSELMTLRGCIGTLYDYDDQPIPFIYVHLVFLMSMFYCPLVAYTAAVYMPAKTVYIFPDLLGFFVVFLNMVFVIGLREIGHAMNSPYEDSLQDLSVLHYLNFTISATRKVLSGSSMPSPGIEIEEELEAARPDLGLAFIDHTVSTGGPRMNNYHQSSLLLHQHKQFHSAHHQAPVPPHPHATPTSSMASSKSAPDITLSQFGVYAPYLAGSIHPAYQQSLHAPHSASPILGLHPTYSSSFTIPAHRVASPSVDQLAHQNSHQQQSQQHHQQQQHQHHQSKDQQQPLHNAEPTDEIHPHLVNSAFNFANNGGGRESSGACVEANTNRHDLGQGGVNHSHSFSQGIGMHHYSNRSAYPSPSPPAIPAPAFVASAVLMKGGALERTSHATATSSATSTASAASALRFPAQLPSHHAHIQTSPSTVSLTSLIEDNSDKDTIVKPTPVRTDQPHESTTYEDQFIPQNNQTNHNSLPHQQDLNSSTSSSLPLPHPLATNSSGEEKDEHEMNVKNPSPRMTGTRKRRSTRIYDSADSMAFVPEDPEIQPDSNTGGGTRT